MKSARGKKTRLGFSTLAFLPVFLLIMIAVIAGHTEGVRADAYVYGSGSISGTVTDEVGQPLQNVSVTVYKYGTYPWGGNGWYYFTSAYTDADGNYSITGLTTGEYKVGFSVAAGYVSELYNDKHDLDSADLVTVTQGSTTENINASLAAVGAISGAVTDEYGAPLQNVYVSFYRLDAQGNWDGYPYYVYTDANGNYSKGELPSGDYKVSFHACGYSECYGGNYMSEYFDDMPDLDSADLVTVTGGSTTENIDASLSTGGSISGTVTNEAGQPLQGIDVTVYDFADAPWGRPLRTVTTDVSGNYSVGGLTSVDYKVEFRPHECYGEPGCTPGGSYFPEYYNDKADLNSADPVSVTQGSDTEDIDASLAAAGSISGTVTDEAGQPIQNISVYVYRTDGSWAGSANTDADGNYSVSNLATGEYKVRYSSTTYCPYPGCTPSNYMPEYFNDKPDLDSADPVYVAEGSNTENIDASLATGGSITGTVTDEAGQPVQDIVVNVYKFENYWTYAGSVNTDAGGNYSVGSLGTGDYKVEFRNGSCYPSCAQNYSPEYYDDKPDLLSADLVPVTQGSATENIDASLAAGGSISGTVTDNSGQPLQYISVYAYKVAEGDNAISSAGSASTDANGNYSIVGLDTGNYRVQFYGYPNYPSEYYDDQPSMETADLIPVTAGSDTSNIDASLAAPAQISGHVTDETGQSLQGVRVTTYKFDSASGDWLSVGGADTDANGDYAVNGLAAGDYRVGFSSWYCSYPGCTPGNYAPEYYNDKTDLDSADTITLIAGGSATNIDASLATGGSITGNVTDESGQPIQGIEVSVYESSGAYVQLTYTDANGDYFFDGLATTEYKLWFNTNYHQGEWISLGYAPEYYSDKSDFASANPVSVTAGTATPNINASLASGGSITGTITNEAGQSLQDIPITLYQLSDMTGEWYPSYWGSTDGLGNYSLGGLATGDYKVQFGNSSFSTYLPEYFTDKADLDSADLVSVITGAATENIDAALVCTDNDAPNVTVDSPIGTVVSDSPAIAADYNDGSGTGIDISTVSVALDGNDVTGNCTVGINSVSCSTNSLAQGSHTVSVNVSDNVGNTGSDSSTFTVNTKPALTLSTTNVYWSSYSDYEAGLLSIDFNINNEPNSASATGVQIVGVESTNGVTIASTSLPHPLGTINAGNSAEFTLQYAVPSGVGSFGTTLYVTAEGGFAYPGPYNG